MGDNLVNNYSTLLLGGIETVYYKTNKKRIITAITFAVCMNAFGQPKSAVEFYDTTGAQSVAKFGWTGDATNGNFYVRTPGDGNGVTVKQGNLTANKVTADGSGITNIPQSAVTGLSDSISRKAATTHAHPISSIPGLQDSLSAKASASAIIAKTYIDTNLAKKANISHPHATTDVTWGTGANGQVWKVGSNGQPAWGADNTGGSGVSVPIGITDVTGLTDSITNHRAAITGKAATVHTHTISDVAALQTTVGAKADSSAVYTKAATDAKVGGKADTTYGYSKGFADSKYAAKAIMNDSLTAHRTMINTKANTADVYTKTQSDGLSGGQYDTKWAYETPISSSTATPFSQITITVPAAGYVMVWATAMCRTPGTAGYYALRGTIGTSATDEGSSSLWYEIHWSGDLTIPKIWSMNRMFPVSAGQNTFYLNFWKGTALNPFVDASSLTALYVKTQM